MLADEATQQKAAAVEAAALQQQLAQAQQAAASSQQQLEHTAAQLAEAQQALVDADRLHSRAVKRLDRKMLQLAQECDLSRQELLIKSAEILDLQAQLKEAAGQHEMQLVAAQDQVGRRQRLTWLPEMPQLSTGLQARAHVDVLLLESAVTGTPPHRSQSAVVHAGNFSVA